MPYFEYQGRNTQGQFREGHRESHSAEILGSQLLLEGITPIKITLIKEKTTWFTLPSLLEPITNEEILIFCQQMAALLQAGIPLLRSLQRISDTLKNKKFKKIILQLAQSVSEGTPLSKALLAYPNVFKPLFYNLVLVGEQSGNLVEIFQQLIDYLIFEDTTRKRILTTLRYPMTVVIFIFLALIVINIFVIPVFAKLYQGFHVNLPLPTRILIGFSNFIRQDGIAVLILLSIMGLIAKHYSKTTEWKLFFGRLILKVPIVGGLLHRILLARFARSLGLVYLAGIPLINALKLVAESTSNRYVQQHLLKLRDYLSQGENLSAAATKISLFSPVIIQMLTVGEETGSLDKILFQIATYYETTIDYDIKRLADRVEPLLLIFIGGLILILALGIFLPMWNLVHVMK